MLISPTVRRSLWPAGLAVGLYLLFIFSQWNYLLFHTFAEIFGATVAVSVFLIAWNSRKIVRNDFLLFLGIVFLFVSALDSLHTLAYEGMSVFPSFLGANLSAQLWLIGRYLFAVSLLIAPIFLTKRLSARLLTAVYAVIVTLLLLTVFYWRNFPVAYIEGVGLTEFKLISEYAIILFLFAAGMLLYRFRRKLDSVIYHNLSVSITFALVCELLTTLYVGVYDPFNFLGHIAKIISYFYLYKAVVEVSLDKPYALLFRRLELANARKDDFIRFLGHELRTPLTTVKLYAEMLAGDLAREESKEKAEMAELIGDQANVIQLLISDLVDASRLETGTISFEMKSVDIGHLVAESVEISRQIYRSKKVEFHSIGEVRASVWADPRRLMQVLSNLIANGIKYSESPIRITIHLELRGGEVAIGVRDEGVGIATADLNKIFDKHYRTKEGETRAKGLGLGLYLANEIVKRHNGRIEVKSKVGEGSTFTVYLPILS